jgi:hypothetical protein
MAAVALALDEDQPLSSPASGGGKSRMRPRRRQRVRVRHFCGHRHHRDARTAYNTTATYCLVHNCMLLTVGDYGRPYPAPGVCVGCLGEIPHERVCPMNADVLAMWVSGYTCICPTRLTMLGLKMQKVPGPGRARKWAVGPG